MGRRFQWRVAVVLVGGILASCGRKAEKPASREEALAACVGGCIKKVEQAQPSDEQRRTCDQVCACIVDETFQANGERRKDPKLMRDVAAACVEGVTAKPIEPERAVDSPVIGTRERPRAAPHIVLAPTLLTGKGCTKVAALPRLTYEERTERVFVPGQAVGWRFPYLWGRPLPERRDVRTLSIAPNWADVTPVFELFVAPRCDSYDVTPVFARMAARGLIELVVQDGAVEQVRSGGWKVERGGPEQATSIIRAAVFSTPKGPRHVWLYTTKLAETKSFSVHAAGACPALQPGSNFPSSCESQYFGMLEPLTAQAPPRPIPKLIP